MNAFVILLLARLVCGTESFSDCLGWNNLVRVRGKDGNLGDRTIGALKIGDMVKTAHGFERVLYVREDGNASVLNVTVHWRREGLATRWLTLSPNHLIYTDNGRVAASALKVGHHVYVDDSNTTVNGTGELTKALVTSIHSTSEKVRNPFTGSGTLFVNDIQVSQFTLSTLPVAPLVRGMAGLFVPLSHVIPFSWWVPSLARYVAYFLDTTNYVMEAILHPTNMTRTVEKEAMNLTGMMEPEIEWIANRTAGTMGMNRTHAGLDMMFSKMGTFVSRNQSEHYMRLMYNFFVSRRNESSIKVACDAEKFMGEILRLFNFTAPASRYYNGAS